MEAHFLRIASLSIAGTMHNGNMITAHFNSEIISVNKREIKTDFGTVTIKGNYKFILDELFEMEKQKYESASRIIERAEKFKSAKLIMEK